MSNIFVTIGASNHSSGEREENDFYATEPRAVELLLENEIFNNSVLEPSCGKGHISEVLLKDGYNVTSSDLVDRGYGTTKDFFEIKRWEGDIITNPPYKIALKYTEHALDILGEGSKLALFLKLTFLEGKQRKLFFEKNPPKKIYVFSGRVNCAKNGEFEKYTSSAVAYAWFIWKKGYCGKPEINWIN